MKNYPCWGCGLAFLFLANLPRPAYAGDETYKFVIGGSMNSFNSQLALNDKAREKNTDFDLEDDLDYDSKLNLLALKGSWRFSDKHRVSLEYVPISRSSKNELLNDVEYKDVVLKSGSAINTESDITIFDINYAYSFYKTDDLEIAASGGIYWMSLDFAIEASGSIETADGSNDFDGEYSDSAGLDAPLPLLGLRLNWEFAENWELLSSARIFKLGVSDFSGQVLSAQLAVDYSFTEHFAGGLSVGGLHMDLDVDKPRFDGSYSWDYNALQVYVVLRY